MFQANPKKLPERAPEIPRGHAAGAAARSGSGQRITLSARRRAGIGYSGWPDARHRARGIRSGCAASSSRH
jgi:hypothetical protein